MPNITTLLSRIDAGDPAASHELLPLVYEELRKLAAARMAREAPGQTLQATALVHEAYLRLLKDAGPGAWDSRGHFFASAAEAMRRILIDRARQKQRPKHGGDLNKLDLEIRCPASDEMPDRLSPPSRQDESPTSRRNEYAPHPGSFAIPARVLAAGIARSQISWCFRP